VLHTLACAASSVPFDRACCSSVTPDRPHTGRCALTPGQLLSAQTHPHSLGLLHRQRNTKPVSLCAAVVLQQHLPVRSAENQGASMHKQQILSPLQLHQVLVWYTPLLLVTACYMQCMQAWVMSYMTNNPCCHSARTAHARPAIYFTLCKHAEQPRIQSPFLLKCLLSHPSL
jgi:hypothetical protein